MDGNTKNPHFVSGRSGIVEMFEWKFTDIAKECELFLSKYGYGGILVSPVTENSILEGRPWIERYHLISYKIITRSGNEEQFRDMVKRCNDVGVRTYVDVIISHMAGDSSNPKGVGGSIANLEEKSYPDVGFSKPDFHETCSIKNYKNRDEVRRCQNQGYHDLNEGVPNVRAKIIEFINKLIDIGIAGIRVDGVKHMNTEHLELIYSEFDGLNSTYFKPNSKLFIYQEIIDFGNEGVKATEYTHLGRVTDFKFGNELGRVFGGHDQLKWLRNFGTAWKLQKDLDSVVFIDDHDTQRSIKGNPDNTLTYKRPKQYKMATAFMLAWPHGIAKIMSSYFYENVNEGPPHDPSFEIIDVEYNPDDTCRNGWMCEHRWRQIYNMIGFRNAVQGTNVTNWWDNGHNQIAFCRGDKGFIVFNQDGHAVDTKLQTCLPQGFYCDIISGTKTGICTGDMIEVDDQGYANIFLPHDIDDGVIAFHVNACCPLLITYAALLQYTQDYTNADARFAQPSPYENQAIPNQDFGRLWSKS